MPDTPATMALRRISEDLDILRGRRLAAEEFRRYGPWWDRHRLHLGLPSLQDKVREELAREREQDGQISPGVF